MLLLLPTAVVFYCYCRFCCITVVVSECLRVALPCTNNNNNELGVAVGRLPRTCIHTYVACGTSQAQMSSDAACNTPLDTDSQLHTVYYLANSLLWICCSFTCCAFISLGTTAHYVDESGLRIGCNKSLACVQYFHLIAFAIVITSSLVAWKATVQQRQHCHNVWLFESVAGATAAVACYKFHW